MGVIMPKVVLLEGSLINHFDYGDFKGFVDQRHKREAKWDPSKEMMIPAKPACWRVTVQGSGRAWCEVSVPLSRTKSLRKAIEIACSQFTSPDDIKMRYDDRGPIYGSFKELN